MKAMKAQRNLFGLIAGIALVGCLGPSASATDRYVSLTGHHQPPFTNWWGAATNIQTAVNAATNGDTVWVRSGTYVLTNQITITNVPITLCSVDGPLVTTIDGGYPASSNLCFYVTIRSTIRGFTVQNGYCTNTTSSVGNGGGFRLGGAGALVEQCIVRNNHSWGNGGGIYCGYSGTVRDCLIIGNTANDSGGGIYCNHLGYDGGNVENCTIVSNTAQLGGGIFEYQQGFYSQGYLRNLIVYYNTATMSGANYYNNGGDPTNRYSYCCTTPEIGERCITNAPQFVNPTNDFRLATSSPCIDKGTNQAWMAATTDLNGNQRIVNSLVDIGAYEAVPDTDGDGIPDWWMMQRFGHPTGQSGDQSLAGDDPDGDGYTNLEEFQNGGNPLKFDVGSAYIWMAVEVGWKGVAGTNYQVQCTTNLSSGNWTNWGGVIVGNGGTNTILDSTRANERKYYRVVVP